MSRTVPEWIGKTDDTRPPPRVLLRIFLRYDGRCQCGCKRVIRCGWGEKWDADHIIALCNGGENRESNYQPLLVEHHKDKTRADVRIKARTDKRRKSHYGVKKQGWTIPGRKFDGTPIPSRRRA